MDSTPTRTLSRVTLALTLGLAACACLSAPAQAATLTAGSCDPNALPTIQLAVDRAQAGDTVVVCPGEYRESVIVGTPELTIRSRDGAQSTLVAPAGYSGFLVLSRAVRIGCLGTVGGGCQDSPAPGAASLGFTIGPAGIPIDVTSDEVSRSYGAGGDAGGGRVEGNVITGFREAGISIDEGADGTRVRGNMLSQTSGMPPSGSIQPPVGDPVGAPLPLSANGGIVVNNAGNPARPPTNGVQITGNTVVSPPGFAGSGQGPSGASVWTGIAIWNHGSGHVVSGNRVRGAGVGISLSAGVVRTTVSGNSVGPATGTAADETDATLPAGGAIGLRDVNSSGVFALGLRNLWYDNTCSPAYQRADPDELCSLSGPPPNPVALDRTTFVEGIPATLKVQGTAGDLSSARVKLGGDPDDPSGYDAFGLNHAIAAPAAGSYVVYAQASEDPSGEAPISPPVPFPVTVDPNQLPQPVPGTQVQLDEDAPGSISLGSTGNEPEEAVVFEVTDAASLDLGRLEGIDASGRVTHPEGRVTYVPDSNEHGSESFHFVACDRFARPDNPRGCSAPEAVEVSVAAVDDPPLPSPVSASGDEDAVGIPVALSATDVEGDRLSFALVGARPDGTLVTEKGGTVELDGSSATYVPAANFNGSDSFRYSASDGSSTVSAPVDVTVSPVNDAPAARAAAVKLTEGSQAAIELGADDVDGEPLSYELVEGPGHGTLLLEGSLARYTPSSGFSGADFFRFRASDPSGAAGEATISIEVQPLPVEPPRRDPAPSTTGPTATGPATSGPATGERRTAGQVHGVSGTVVATAPGGDAARLSVGASLPEGTTIDASRGRVTIEAPAGGGDSRAVQAVTVSQGSFALRTVREHGRVVLVLRMVSSPGSARSKDSSARARSAGKTLRLLVAGRCRCRVVSRDATISSTGIARWLTVQDARRTSVKLSSGRVRVAGRARGCRAYSLPRPERGRAGRSADRFTAAVQRKPCR